MTPADVAHYALSLLGGSMTRAAAGMPVLRAIAENPEACRGLDLDEALFVLDDGDADGIAAYLAGCLGVDADAVRTPYPHLDPPWKLVKSGGGWCNTLADAVEVYLAERYGGSVASSYAEAFGCHLAELADEVPFWGSTPIHPKEHPLLPASRGAPLRPRPPKKPKRQGVVYVAIAGPRVKIGFSTDVSRRIAQLAAQTPYEMRLLATSPGTVDEEAALHRRFDDCRVHGEWFEPDTEMQAWLDGLAP